MSKARHCLITPLGNQILEAVARGTYTFARKRVVRAGVAMHKGKRRSKFRAPCYAK